MDANTKSYYMEPGEFAFHAYSDVKNIKIRKKSTRIVETDIDDLNELNTIMYNAGFFYGYLDGEKYAIKKRTIYYYDRNPNDVVYVQWRLTHNDEHIAENLKKHRLLTLCRIDEDKVFFPTIKLEDGERAVLAYTDRIRMPNELFEKYDGWRCVNMTFDTKCLVNGEFLCD